MIVTEIVPSRELSHVQMFALKPSNSAIRSTVALLALGPLHASTLEATQSRSSAGRAVILTMLTSCSVDVCLL